MIRCADRQQRPDPRDAEGDAADLPEDTVVGADSHGAEQGTAVTLKDGSSHPGGPREAVEVERSASLLPTGTAVALAAITPISLTGYGLPVSIVGTVIVAIGAVKGSPRRLDAGSLLLLAGIVAAAIQGAPAGTLLLPTVATVVAWDVGRYGIVVGDQLGKNAATARIEAAHAGWSLAVGAFALLPFYAAIEYAGSGSVIGNWSILIGVVILVTSHLLDG